MQIFFASCFLGFRCAPPQALRCRRAPRAKTHPTQDGLIQSFLLIKPELWRGTRPAVFQGTNERGRGRLQRAVARFPFSDPAFHGVRHFALALLNGLFIRRGAIRVTARTAFNNSDS